MDHKLEHLMLESLYAAVSQKSLSIVIESHPPSTNRIWRQGNRRVYKTPQATAWDAKCRAITTGKALELYGTTDLSGLKGLPLSLELAFVRAQWTGKARSMRGLLVRPDVSNFIKTVEDSVLNALGLDDSAVVELHARKVTEPGPDRTRVRLSFLPIGREHQDGFDH